MEANMKIFESKSNANLIDLQKEQAKKLGISFDELKALYNGKSCAKYGTKELLHARKVRGGKIVVFNISEKYRGEKISEGRKKLKSNPDSNQVIDA